MTYWLSIHYPPEMGKPIRDDDNYVWIKEIQRNTCLVRMRDGDKVAIYERGWRRGNQVRMGARGEQLIPLEEGQKAVRAIVEVMEESKSGLPGTPKNPIIRGG